MNIPLDRKLCRPAPPLPAARLKEATVIAIGESLCAVFLDRPTGRRERVGAEQDGSPIPRPFIVAELPLRSGGVRHVLLVAQATQTVLSRHLVLTLDGKPAAQIDPDWLQPPQEDLPALAAQLSPQGIRRLLRMMLTTGASLFAADAQAGLAAAILRLMDVCDVPTLEPVARVEVAGRILVSYDASSLPEVRGVPDAMAVVEGRLAPARDIDCHAEGGVLHVLLPPGLAGAPIMTCTNSPLRLAAPNGAVRQLSAAAWMRDRDKTCRDWLLARPGFVMNVAARPADAVEPGITVNHLSSSPAGLLHALMLDDPSHLVRKVVLEHGEQRTELAPRHGADGKALLIGLADISGPARAGAMGRISVRYHSGHGRIMAEAAIGAYDGGIPPGFAEAWTLGVDVLDPLARARAGFCRAAPLAVSQHFGARRTCGLRIVTAIGTSADLIRARAAMILAEGCPTPVEVVCTMTEGPLAIAARHAVSQTAAIYGIPHRLVLLPDHATTGERLRAALADAHDAPALVLGGDVLPQGRGWLGFWLRRLRRRDALAPALLAGDGSVAATQEGPDSFKGLPAALLPPSGRVVDRPLAGCLGLGPAGIARLLNSGAPHPDPAVWIASALGGAARSETRFSFCRFGPAAVPDAFAAALAKAEFALIGKDRP